MIMIMISLGDVQVLPTPAIPSRCYRPLQSHPGATDPNIQSCLMPKPSAHLTLSLSRWTISTVDPLGQFAALGVRPGWRVVAVNGARISNVNQEVRARVEG